MPQCPVKNKFINFSQFQKCPIHAVFCHFVSTRYFWVLIFYWLFRITDLLSYCVYLTDKPLNAIKWLNKSNWFDHLLMTYIRGNKLTLQVADSCSEEKIWTATGFHYLIKWHKQKHATNYPYKILWLTSYFLWGIIGCYTATSQPITAA